MDTLLMTMLPFLVFFAFLLYQVCRRVACPDCGDIMPTLYSPRVKTRRMWRAGGYLCARCGCETNMAGEKITADMPPAPFPTLQWSVLALLFVVGLGLAASMFNGPPAAAPIVQAAPVVVELPLQAPVVAPAE